MDIKEHSHKLELTIEGPLYSGVKEGEPFTGQIASWIQRCSDNECEYVEIVAQGIERHMLKLMGQGEYITKHGAFMFKAS